MAVAALVAATMPLLAPLAHEGVPATGDGYLHLQRVMLLDHARSEGVWWSRWLADVAYGHGAPVFTFYAPLAYLPAHVATWLGVGYVAAFKLTNALILVGAPLAMYSLARAVGSRVAAWTAAVAYAYLPYQLVDVYARGALPEAATFVWIPLAALGLVALAHHPRRRTCALCGLTIAALVATHNATALVTLPALGLLGLLLGLRADARRRFVVLGVVAFALGLSISAAFWLPAMLERDAVSVGSAVSRDTLSRFLFRDVSPVQGSLHYDYRSPSVEIEGFGWFWPRTGLVQALVAVAGVLFTLRLPHAARPTMVWATAIALGGLALQAWPARILYDAVPLLAFVQFPWRLLTLVGVGTSILAAAAVDGIGIRPIGPVAAAALISIASAAAALWSFEPRYDYPRDELLTAESVLRAEIADYGIGTTHFGEFLPRAVGSDGRDRLRRRLLGTEPAPALAPMEPPQSIRLIESRPTGLAIDIDTVGPTVLRLQQFGLPGWRVGVNGVEAPWRAEGRMGLPATRIESGSNRVKFELDDTPAKLVGLVLSGLGLLVVAWMVARRNGRRNGVIAAGALMAAVGLINAAPDSAAAVVDREPRSVLGGRLLLLSTDAVGRAGVVSFTHTWLVLAPTGGVELIAQVDGATARWAHGLLSRSWEPGTIVRTRMDLRHVAPTTTTARFHASTGGPTAASTDTWTTALPTRSPTVLDDPRGVGPIAAIEGVELLAARVAAGGPVSRAGGSLGYVLEWRVTAEPRAEPSVELLLVGDRPIASSGLATVGSWVMPAIGWQVGDRFRQEVSLRIPDDAVAGAHRAVARLEARERSWLARPTEGRQPGRQRQRLDVELGMVDVR
jgi:hypothetical protein